LAIAAGVMFSGVALVSVRGALVEALTIGSVAVAIMRFSWN
jgi:hypothetical protein